MRHCITLLFILTLQVIAGQNTLKYNLSVDDAFTVSQEAIQTITQDLNGVEQVIINDLVGAMHFKVIEIEPNLITFEMTFKHLKMLMSSPTLGEMMNMDTSSEDASDFMSMMMKGILDKVIFIKMETNGKIQSVIGGEALIQEMINAAGITQPEAIAATKAQMENQFGTKALTHSFEQMTYFFSTEDVNENDSWKNNYNGDLKAENTWKLTNLSDDTYEISGEAVVNMSSKNETVTMNLSGEQKTTIKGNPKTGLFNELTVNGDSKGNSVMGGMTIPTTIKSKITYKISK